MSQKQSQRLPIYTDSELSLRGEFLYSRNRGFRHGGCSTTPQVSEKIRDPLSPAATSSHCFGVEPVWARTFSSYGSNHEIECRERANRRLIISVVWQQTRRRMQKMFWGENDWRLIVPVVEAKPTQYVMQRMYHVLEQRHVAGPQFCATQFENFTNLIFRHSSMFSLPLPRCGCEHYQNGRPT